KFGQRKLDMKSFLDLDQEFGRQQRVPAQFEEIIVDPDFFYTERVLPDNGQRLLVFVPRSHVSGPHLWPGSECLLLRAGLALRLLPWLVDPQIDPLLQVSCGDDDLAIESEVQGSKEGLLRFLARHGKFI